MKLLVAVTSKSDAPVLASAMSKEGYPATVISSYGGFLREENAAIFSGIEDIRVNNVIGIIKANTSQSTVDILPEKAYGNYKLPPQIKVSGAVVFTVDIEHLMRL
jgi:uncharacterized protein YaaQ